MFTSARLKLTAWYLLIIMCISILFSLGIYVLINDDYNRIEQMQLARQEREQRLRPFYELYQQQLGDQGFAAPTMPPAVDLAPVSQARMRLQVILILINLGILMLAGGAGYFLAGRTLRPIKKMIDEQNRFITDASHELRTPLTALKTSIEVGLRDQRLTKQEAVTLLGSNLEEVNDLQYLSDNLIKLTQNQQTNGLIFEKVALGQITSEAIKKVSKLAKPKKITIGNQVKNIFIEADRQSLIELLVIFLDNAIKYSDPGKSVTISSKVIDHNLVLEVTDQGKGIDQKDLPYLFDRFYRADKSRSETPGYGLGLSIAKKIVDNHHGEIEVDSQPNNGTKFIITLPLKQ